MLAEYLPKKHKAQDIHMAVAAAEEEEEEEEEEEMVINA